MNLEHKRTMGRGRRWREGSVLLLCVVAGACGHGSSKDGSTESSSAVASAANGREGRPPHAGALTAGATATAPHGEAPARPAPPADDTIARVLDGVAALIADNKPADVKDGRPDPQKPAAADARPSLPFPAGFVPDGNCPALGPAGDADLASAGAATIPLVEGLTLAYLWRTKSTDDGDHECLGQISRINSEGVVGSSSCAYRKDKPERPRIRVICLADLRDSYMFETATNPDFPTRIRGALQYNLSRQSFAELAGAGRTRHRYLELDATRQGEPVTLGYDAEGELQSTGKGTFRVIVNDRSVDLPVIHSTATLQQHNGRPEPLLLTVLDDARFPLVLDYRHPASNFAITFTKISFPTQGDVEKHLAVDKHVDVYGIYFDFASDDLRPESDPVLQEIGAALAKNPDWKLTINGHTDNLGGDAFNLDLSRRRSEAVRKVLVDTYRIDPARLATAGRGATQPKESNATAEGRAKNRRVELVRQ